MTPKLRELLQQNPDQFLTSLARQEKDGLVSLWEGFTSGRKDGIGRYLMNPKRETIAYLLGFHSPNVMRSLNLWDRVTLRIPGDFHTLDIGCGTGAFTQGLLLTVDQRRLRSVVLLDKNAAFLETAEELTKVMLNNVENTRVFASKKPIDEWIKGDASAKALESFGEDTVVVQLGYVWNELARQPETQRRLITWLEKLEKRGPVILVVAEPANQMLAREAMGLRNSVVQDMAWTSHYPCPHQAACPMLLKARDWCYSEFSWQRPVWQRNIDKVMDVDRGLLSGAMYVFSSSKGKVLVVPNPSRQNIVVGRPLTRHGKNAGYRHLICTSEGKLEQGALQPEGAPATLHGEPIVHSQKAMDDHEIAD